MKIANRGETQLARIDVIDPLQTAGQRLTRVMSMQVGAGSQWAPEVGAEVEAGGGRGASPRPVRTV